jgi:hypothetical protein
MARVPRRFEPGNFLFCNLFDAQSFVCGILVEIWNHKSHVLRLYLSYINRWNLPEQVVFVTNTSQDYMLKSTSLCRISLSGYLPN